MKNLLLLSIFFSSLFAAEKYTPEYVWNLGIAMNCDVTPFGKGLPDNYESIPLSSLTNPQKYIKTTERGDIIWVQSARLPLFIKKTFPQIKEPFVLVVTDGDESFPSYVAKNINIEEFLQSDLVLHVFAQNIDRSFRSRKVSHIPIGMDFHSIARAGGFFGESSRSVQRQEIQLQYILDTLEPTTYRKKRALIEFHLNNAKIYGGGTRADVANIVMQSGVVDVLQQRVSRSELWRKKGEYAFSISPHGNGLDCHRTWEDLVLGCIVVVKTSPLDPLYQGLPVVIVKEWSEVTEENMDKWLAQFGDAFSNPDYRYKLTHKYWMNTIRSKRNGSF